MNKLALVLLLLFVRSAFAQSLQSPSSGTFADLDYQCSYKAPDHANTPMAAMESMQNDGYARGYCFGVLTTAIDLLKDSGEIQLTTDSTLENARKIVKDYLSANPGESQKPITPTLRAALKQAWGTHH